MGIRHPLYQRPATDVAVLLQQNIAAQDDAVVYATFTGNGRLDTQYAMVGNLYVVAQVYTIHQIVFIADFGALPFVCSAADNHILPDVILVADNE